MGRVTPPHLTTTLFPSWSVDILYKDDVTVIILLGVSSCAKQISFRTAERCLTQKKVLKLTRMFFWLHTWSRTQSSGWCPCWCWSWSCWSPAYTPHIFPKKRNSQDYCLSHVRLCTHFLHIWGLFPTKFLQLQDIRTVWTIPKLLCCQKGSIIKISKKGHISFVKKFFFEDSILINYSHVSIYVKFKYLCAFHKRFVVVLMIVFHGE